MRRAFRLAVTASLASLIARAPAADADPKADAFVDAARKVFESAAQQVYAEWIRGLPRERKDEMRDALGCEDDACAQKAAAFLVASCPAFTVTTEEAAAIAAGKFDDAANEASAKACAKSLEALHVPLPLLFAHLIEKVKSKQIQGGAELEFAARFLAFHASRAAKMLADKSAGK